MVPARDVPTRRVDFGLTHVRERHYMGGDLLQSHLVSLGSAVFPPGEEFFVRTVRRYRERIVDAELRSQVAGFIGQEAMHGREHRKHNEELRRLGYPTRFVERAARFGLGIVERTCPGHVQLAVTAALEHYTATLAAVMLTDPAARAAHTHEQTRRLYLWHALEETEHKAVAFDVFQHVSGNQRVRVRVMRILTVHMAVYTTLGLLISLMTDPAAWNPRRLWHSIRALRSSPFFDPAVGRQLRDYNRPDFHPDDHETADLVTTWRTELFPLAT
jgi:predicted metal-dependent hydrolase